MPKVVGSMVLPRLHVTADDVASLRALSAALEKELVSEFEDYVRRGRQVDKSKWKMLRSAADLRAYQEREEAASPKRNPAREPQATMARESRCSRVLVTGTEAGTVDDAMYGCSFYDTASLRIHEAYQRAFLDDSAVLCTIDGPTQDDPYQFMGLAWHLRGFRLTKDRDVLLLQLTRITTLSTGERIGISIRHSVEHRDLPELLDFSTLRILLSAPTIYRQLDLDNVELFGIEFLDEKRRGPDIVQLHEFARGVLTCVSACDTGFKKKLHWLMRKRHNQIASEQTHDMERPKREDCCVLCTRPTSGLFSGSGASCQLCTKYVCSRCLVTHEIVVDASSANTAAKPFGFCVECILHTKRVPTLQVAREELASRRTLSGKARSSVDGVIVGRH